MIHFSPIMPNPLLQKYVYRYWRISSDSASEGLSCSRIFPDSFTDIIFNFGDPIIHLDGSGQTAPSTGKAMVSGIMKKPRIVGMQGKIDAIGVSFRPGYAPLFLQIPMHEIADLNVRLSDIVVRNTRSLVDTVLGTERDSDRLRAIDYFLCTIGLTHLPIDPAVEASVRYICTGEGRTSIDDLGPLTGYSKRQIERKFLQHVGLGPKALAMIVRFQRALTMLKRPGSSLVSTALEAGYSDQAHFNREIKDFTGLTPGTLLREKRCDVAFIQD